jgi:hypothetical protein
MLEHLIPRVLVKTSVWRSGASKNMRILDFNALGLVATMWSGARLLINLSHRSVAARMATAAVMSTLAITISGEPALRRLSLPGQAA